MVVAFHVIADNPTKAIVVVEVDALNPPLNGIIAALFVTGLINE